MSKQIEKDEREAYAKFEELARKLIKTPARKIGRGGKIEAQKKECNKDLRRVKV